MLSIQFSNIFTIREITNTILIYLQFYFWPAGGTNDTVSHFAPCANKFPSNEIVPGHFLVKDKRKQMYLKSQIVVLHKTKR